MGRADKALERLLSVPTPRDYTWAELVAVMTRLNYDLKFAGGSGRKFIHRSTQATLMLHEPHPGSILKVYQVRDVIRFLRQEGALDENLPPRSRE